MHGSPNQHDDSISQYSRERRPSMVDAGIRMDEDEFTTPDDVNGTGENEVNHDVSMEPMSVPFAFASASTPLIYPL
jgi:hypothetical protein